MKNHFRINVVLIIISLLGLISVYVSPETFWVVGFISFAIPPLLFFNLIYVLFWLRKKMYKRLLLSLALLVLGWPQINRTFSFDYSDPSDETGLKILSANVRVFNVYKHLRENDPESSDKLINWLQQSENDVLCLQEFYNEAGNKTYHVSKILKKQYPYQYVKPVFVNRIGAQFGAAIFSKHKILNSGTIPFKEVSNNQALYVDLLWDKDTVRIYNIHLESMQLFNNPKTQNDLKNTGKDTFRRLKGGFVTRARQIDLIINEIKKCHYPVLVCGDLNDLPYSYTYQELRSVLSNGFEEKGFGFGTTYNGKLPFLRIDNHFFSDDFKINNFEVHKDINHSDHFPITAEYQLKHTDED